MHISDVSTHLCVLLSNTDSSSKRVKTSVQTNKNRKYSVQYSVYQFGVICASQFCSDVLAAFLRFSEQLVTCCSYMYCNNTCTVWANTDITHVRPLRSSLPVWEQRREETCWHLVFWTTDVLHLYVPDVPTVRGRSASCRGLNVRLENLHSSGSWSRARRF